MTNEEKRMSRDECREVQRIEISTMFVFCGEKRRRRAIPKGYVVIDEGVTVDGDMGFDIGSINWYNIPKDALGEDIFYHYIVIRKRPTKSEE